MARGLPLLLAGAACATAAAASGGTRAGAGSVAAVQKVIGMLQDMSAKAKQEKKDEEVAFAKFETWCAQESSDLKSYIAKGSEEIELLGASIGKLGSDVATLGEEITQHEADKAEHEADLKAATEQRAKDHEAFVAEEQDYSESVDAIDRALAILSKEDYDRPGAAAALLQVGNGRLPEKARALVTTFMDMLRDGKDSPLGGTDYAAPEANAYEFQSGGLINMLKKLQDDFRSQLSTCQKEEMNSQHAYNMAASDHKDFINNSERAAGEKSKEKDRKTEQKALDTKQKRATEGVKAENEKTLSETTAECSEKKLSFQEKQQLRAEEIEAIAKAVEILSGSEVSGGAEKHLALAQARDGRSLVFLRSADRASGIHRRIREFLESEGRRLKSQRLSMLAQRVMADPFAKVKQMIDAMITRLLEEAKQDAEHEGFCDEELGKSKITRTKLSEDIDALEAAIESGKATIAGLAADTTQLSKEVAELEKAVAEATELRNAEKAKNTETVADAKAAQKAVAAATAVLRDFYEKASTATAFVQLRQGAPEPRAYGLKMGVKMGTEEWKALANPEYKGTAGSNYGGKLDRGHKEGMQTFGEKEEGQQDEASYGVLGLLEIILSDFANLEADTNAAEAAAAEAYERYMVESKKSKATKEKKIELNSADQAAAEAKLQEDTADLKATQDELLAADRVYEKLVPQCIDQGMTWEERTAARQAEIDSLKEALKLLSMPDIA